MASFIRKTLDWLNQDVGSSKKISNNNYPFEDDRWLVHIPTRTAMASAGFMSHEEITRRGYFGPEGLPVGRYDKDIVRFPRSEGHVTCIGATRSGKSQGIAIPMLLDHKGPAVVMDVKGELYKNTSKHRSKLGPVVVIDPFNIVTDTTDSFDPFHACMKNPAIMIDETRDLASRVCPKGMHREEYWTEGGRSYLQGFFLACAYGFITFEQMVSRIVSPNSNSSSYELKMFEGFLERRDAEFSQILTIVQATLDIFLDPDHSTKACHQMSGRAAMSALSSPNMISIFSSSSFDVEDTLKNGTIYIVWPQQKVEALSSALRIIIDSLCSISMSFDEPYKRPLLFAIDEMGQIGDMPSLKTMLTLGSGFGLRLASFWQSTSQMTDIYGASGKLFLDQAAMTLVLSGADNESNSTISNILGSTTIDFQGRKIDRPLLAPHEVREMPRDNLLAIPQGEKPILLRKNWIFEDVSECNSLGNLRGALPDNLRLEHKTVPKMDFLVTRSNNAALVEEFRNKGSVETASIGKSKSSSSSNVFAIPQSLDDIVTDSFEPVERGEMNVRKALFKEKGRFLFPNIFLPTDSPAFNRQGDLVVVDKDAGIFVVEVKAGRLKYESGAWQVATVSNETYSPMKRSPGKQVKSFCRMLTALMERFYNQKFVIHPVLAFPDMLSREILNVDSDTAACRLLFKDTFDSPLGSSGWSNDIPPVDIVSPVGIEGTFAIRVDLESLGCGGGIVGGRISSHLSECDINTKTIKVIPDQAKMAVLLFSQLRNPPANTAQSVDGYLEVIADRILLARD